MQSTTMHTIPGARTALQASGAAADAAHIIFGTGAELARQEIAAIRGHLADLAERFSVARNALDVFDLIDTQLDLMHETRRRLADHRLRRRNNLLRMRSHLAHILRRLRGRSA